MRPRGRTREALIRWRGYSCTGDTWEPEEHVKPAGKIKKYLEQPPALVDMKLPHWLFLDAVARQLTSQKSTDRGPRWKHEIILDSLVLPEVALQLLDILRKQVQPPLKLEKSQDGRTTTLYVDQLEDVARVVALHISRPENGTGALRIKCGKASYKDMLMVVPPLEISYTAPPDVQGLPAKGARKFLVRLTTVVFNGITGAARWPAVAAPEDRYSLAEQRHIVAHAKAALAQEWAPARISHPLFERKWHLLPPHQLELPPSAAFA